MDDLTKELLNAVGVSPELRKKVQSAMLEIADDHDIAPSEAFRRGLKAGMEIAAEGLLDRVKTLRAAFPKDKGKSPK